MAMNDAARFAEVKRLFELVCDLLNVADVAWREVPHFFRRTTISASVKIVVRRKKCWLVMRRKVSTLGGARSKDVMARMPSFDRWRTRCAKDRK